MPVGAPGEYASCHENENEMKRYEKPGTCSCSEGAFPIWDWQTA